MSLRLKPVRTRHGVTGAGGGADAGRAGDGGHVSLATATENAIKLIPGEVVIVYPTVLTLCSLTPSPDLVISLSTLALFGVVLWFRLGGPSALRPQRVPAVISAATFIIWAYMLGGHVFLKSPPGWEAAYSIALIIISVVAAAAAPKGGA